MKPLRWRYALFLAAGVLAAASVTVVGVQLAVGSANSPSIRAVSRMSDSPVAVGPGQTMKLSSEESVIDTASAIAIVRQRLDPKFLASAREVVTLRARYTNSHLATSVIPVDALVWIVTVDGLEVPSFNDTTITQMNYVIDAKTGTLLEAYSGPPAPR